MSELELPEVLTKSHPLAPCVVLFDENDHPIGYVVKFNTRTLEYTRYLVVKTDVGYEYDLDNLVTGIAARYEVMKSDQAS